MDAGYKELEHRWEEQQLHIREQAQQIQDTEYLGLLGSSKKKCSGLCQFVCVCVFLQELTKKSMRAVSICAYNGYSMT